MIVVTTTTEPLAWQVERARSVAERAGVPCVPRRGAFGLVLAEGATVVYLVGRDRDELWSAEGRIHVHAGLLASRLRDGARHPLIRAVGPVRTVIDGTLGLAVDALHLAASGAQVHGIEASALVASLHEEGLARLARSADPRVAGAAAAIRPTHGVCAEVLAGLPAGAADAVFVEPMFPRPKAAAPGYAVFREVAVHGPVDEETVRQALRVAPRLVVKVPSAHPAPAALVPYGPSRVAGRAVDYWVVPSIVAGEGGATPTG